MQLQSILRGVQPLPGFVYGHDLLATADRHAIQVVADQVSGTTPAITVALSWIGDV